MRPTSHHCIVDLRPPSRMSLTAEDVLGVCTEDLHVASRAIMEASERRRWGGLGGSARKLPV